MKALKVIWAVARIILTIIVALLVVSTAESRFESVLASSVLMIYAAIRFSAIVQFNNLVDQTKVLTEQFIELAQVVNYSELAQFRSNFATAMKKAEKEMNYGMVEGIALMLVSIAAIANLIVAVL
jgi:hypothetical protein